MQSINNLMQHLLRVCKHLDYTQIDYIILLFFYIICTSSRFCFSAKKKLWLDPCGGHRVSALTTALRRSAAAGQIESNGEALHTHIINYSRFCVRLPSPKLLPPCQVMHRGGGWGQVGGGDRLLVLLRQRLLWAPFVCHWREGWEGILRVNGMVGGGCDWCFFSWIFFFVSSFLTDSSPSLQCTQSPKMTFTKLATSVSLASWEVKKRCCWGGNGHRVSREPNQKKAIKASIPWTLRLSCCCVAVCIVIMVIRAFLCSCFQSDFSFWHLVYTHLLSSLVVTPLLPFLVKLYLVAILWRNINYIELNFFQLFNGTICIFMWTFCICL